LARRMERPRNVQDRSTDNGFQFEFFCDRCGVGHRTRFRPCATGILSGVLDTAGSLFGGLFGQAAEVGERLRSASWERDHDEALEGAAEEILPEFAQCPHCQAWVCRDRCWNEDRGLCKSCAPDLEVERASVQAERAVEAIRERTGVSDEDERVVARDPGRKRRALCPACGHPRDGVAKFCPECGARIEVSEVCPRCGAKMPSAAKFCPDCGLRRG